MNWIEKDVERGHELTDSWYSRFGRVIYSTMLPIINDKCWDHNKTSTKRRIKVSLHEYARQFLGSHPTFGTLDAPKNDAGLPTPIPFPILNLALETWIGDLDPLIQLLGLPMEMFDSGNQSTKDPHQPPRQFRSLDCSDRTDGSEDSGPWQRDGAPSETVAAAYAFEQDREERLKQDIMNATPHVLPSSICLTF